MNFLNKSSKALGAYEKGIVKVLESKLFKMHPATGVKKKKYLSQIDSSKIIP